MSAPKFTPGPWFASDCGDDESLFFIDVELPEGSYADVDGERVFYPSTYTLARLTKKMKGNGRTPWREGEFEANAALIAAAPRMADYIRARAEAGDAEAQEIWEAIVG